MEIIFITGLSGSGKTTSIKTLEDMGYYCVDNLPSNMVDDVIALTRRAGMEKVAFGFGFKDKKSVSEFIKTVKRVKDELEKGEDRVVVVFLDAQDDAILRRYKETRRKHPLAFGGTTFQEAIKKERELLMPIYEISDIKIDTTYLNIHDLRRKIRELFGGKMKDEFMFQVFSFGFRYGIPQEADLVFDVRFIRNPNFAPEMKKFDGTHPEVQKYIFQDKNALKYLDMIKDMLRFLSERFRSEGKYVATIAIGCTGGRHRSVAFAEKIKDFIEKELKTKAVVIHRDKDKDSEI